MPLWLRLLFGLVFEIVSVAVVVGVPGAWLLRHMDLGRLAAAQASAATGRAVTVGSLRLGFGRSVTIDLSDVMVPNIEGGSAPAMITLRHLVAEADLQSLLHGPPLIQHATIEGLDVLLEHTADHGPNWKFGPSKPPPSDPTGRTGFPSLRDVHLKDSRVVYRTRSGKPLVTALDTLGITTAADDQPVRLSIVGSYQGVPLDLVGDLHAINELRDAATPYGTALHLKSGDLTLSFDGSMTDPLNFDGLQGVLQLDAPDPKPLFAVAGVDSALDLTLHLDGPFEHREPVWRLHDAQGQLGQDEVTAATLDFTEGARDKPDRVDVDLAFATLNLNELLGTGTKGKRAGADMPLAADPAPDTLVHAKILAKTLEYNELRASDVTLEGAQTEGRIAVDVFSLTTFGTALKAKGRIEATTAGARVSAQVSAAGADVQVLRRSLGFGSLPLTGRLDGEVVVDSTARTLNAAVRGARVSAIIAMRGGAIAKEVIEMASTDVRALFRTNRGLTPVSCLLAGLDMRDGVGTLAPLRVRAAEGTIAGSATFDLYRRSLDLTIGSEAKSTGLFALDIPVRVTGSFGSPSVAPARWSPQGRAALAAADSLSHLPPALRDWARRYPCPPSR
jgi:uncharacterized protein involved in outer membrane biogenesis